jgi:polar amino acid transport system ATP-binding protein
MNVLDIRNLRKSYGDELVLENIDLTVAKHQVKVVIGASGCGKSTLLRTINLLENIDDGQVFLDGQDISAIDIDVDEVRSNIGSVFQSFNLFPHLTVLENITLAPRLVHGIAKDVAETEALALLTRFNLSDKANKYPELLSGGQQQRVAILRAVINRPKLLLLDEVTSALDPILISEVLTLISDLKRDGMTMIIATHEMGFAKKVADEIIFMVAGKIVESGDPDNLLAHPTSPELKEFLRSLHDAGRL